MTQNREMSLRAAWLMPAESRIARPMAKVLSFAREVFGALACRLTPLRDHDRPAPRGPKELEIRRLEEHFAGAADLYHLELMERDWERREGGGMRTW